MSRNALSDISPLCFFILSGDSGLVNNILFRNVQKNSDQAKPEPAAGALDKTESPDGFSHDSGSSKAAATASPCQQHFSFL